MRTIAQRMSNLRIFTCTIGEPCSPLLLPPRLRELNVRFKLSPVPVPNPLYVQQAHAAQKRADAQVRELNDAIRVIAASPFLERLELELKKDVQDCDLTPLVSTPSLHTLELMLTQHLMELPSTIDALRSMPHLRCLILRPRNVSDNVPMRLFHAPHQMQLDSLYLYLSFTDAWGAAIVHLPTLTNLTVLLSSEHSDFLRQLPHLRILDLSLCDDGGVFVDAERVMASLHSLTGLTDLGLSGNHPPCITTADLAACLPRMPLLTSLHLSGVVILDSLRFLSSGPLAKSLKKLSLKFMKLRLPLSEQVHVHALSALTSLTLRAVCDSPLDEATLRLYTPPSSVLPELCHFEYKHI
jgi:hypothetical protein